MKCKKCGKEITNHYHLIYGLHSDERPSCLAFPEGCETCYNKCGKVIVKGEK